jgi:hypothetical protein
MYGIASCALIVVVLSDATVAGAAVLLVLLPLKSVFSLYRTFVPL